MIKRSINIAMYSMRRWLTNPRYAILFIMQILLMWNTFKPINSLCISTGVRTNPLLFMFYSSNFIQQLILMAGIVFLFANAPFIDESGLYVIQRSGRKSWVMGQIFYIFMASAVYFLILIVISILMLMPYGAFSTDGWGKIVNTLAQSNAGGKINLNFMVEYKIISLYSPFQAIFLCFIIEWLAASIIGMTMFTINLIFKESVGLVFGSAIVLGDILAFNILGERLYKISPVSLGRLSVMDPSKTFIYPNLVDAIIFDVLVLLILCVVSILAVKRKAIEVKADI